ncbi:MAG: AMP-binding protein [Desulfuromonadales bacterium]|nr:AMP-binding protein [Desulfuromonadales bacterium]
MALIVEMLKQSCVAFGDKAAFRVKSGNIWIEHSYRELWGDSDRIATALEQWGLEEGDRCAILAPSSPAWVKAYLGILKANGVAVPIDKELKQAELKHVLANSGTRLLFSEQTFIDLLEEIAGDLPDLEKIILINASPTANDRNGIAHIESALTALYSEWQRLVQQYRIGADDTKKLETRAEQIQSLLFPDLSFRDQEGESTLLNRLRKLVDRKLPKIVPLENFQVEGTPPRLKRHGDDPAVILYTSGTTGRSKGAMLSHNNIVSNIRTCVDLFKLDETIRTLSFLPINHVFEQVGGILLPLSIGGTVSFAESLKKLPANLAEVKPNFLLGVPAVFRLLLDRMTKKLQSQPLSRTLFALPLTRTLVTRKVREAFGGNPVFVSGGAALDPHVATGLQNLGIDIYQGYGITETSPVISAESPFCRKVGTTGRPVRDVEVKIHEPNAEGVGEIWVKGPNVMLGYFNNPEASREVLTDGWYHTGDLGRIDADGMLTICGRVKNLIVTANGKNVYPEEVENELSNSPFIAEIMVYGHKVDATAEEVYAVIYPDFEAIDAHAVEQGKESPNLRQVEDLIRREVLEYGKNLADYKRVRRFNLREDEFPKTTTRKIKRFVVEADIKTET